MGRDYKNLVLIELVCHGVPSELVFQAYCSVLKNKYKSEIEQIEFRSKDTGWHNSSVKVKFNNGRNYRKPTVYDAFMKGFYRNNYLKESCYHCKFRNFQSGADITIGDFWGAEVEIPQMDDNKGLSVVLINSTKGMTFLEELDVECFAFDFDRIIKYNRTIVDSDIPIENREKFYQYVEKNGYEKAVSDLLWETKKDEVQRRVLNLARCVWHCMTGRGKPLY